MHCDFSGDRVTLMSAGNYREIVLTRPEQRNAIDSRMRDELIVVLRGLLVAPGVESIGLIGSGRDFCSGGDLQEFGMGAPVENFSARTSRSLPSLVAQLAERIVVGVQGACVGAGVELASFAQTVIATQDARFWLPELRMGLIPGMGGTVSIPQRIGRGRALRWLLDGKAIDASTANTWGLVDEVVTTDELADSIRRAARLTR